MRKFRYLTTAQLVKKLEAVLTSLVLLAVIVSVINTL